MLSPQMEPRETALSEHGEDHARHTERLLLLWFRQCSPDDKAHAIRFLSALAAAPATLQE